jgi:glutathione S-transferase
MPHPATIIGAVASPFVRKVLGFCALKGVPYRLDPIIPFFGNARFAELSPLRRVPVFIDDRVTLCDSSVICQYLEDRYPDPPLYPADIAARAQARWLEEYADTRLADVVVWRIFNEAVIKPGVWGKPRDLPAIERAVRDELPGAMDYLERVAPAEGFAFGALSIADVAVAAFFRNLRWSRIALDDARWPRTAAWIARVEVVPELARLAGIGDRLVRTPPAEQRAVCVECGLSVTEQSVGADAPQLGPMTAG